MLGFLAAVVNEAQTGMGPIGQVGLCIKEPLVLAPV